MWPFKSSRPPQELLELLESPDAATRKEAYNELIEHDDPAANEVLIEAIRALHEGSKELLLPLMDIAGRRGIEDAVDVIREFLKDEDPEVKLAAIRGLIRIPTQPSLDALLPFLADEDLAIRREVREAITKIFGEKAMGALVRAATGDQNSPLYFEIVSLFEEMGFFDKLRENFLHPDPEVKKFQLTNMMKFHRPDFIPLYLDMYEEFTENPVRQKLRNALLDYSPEELVPCIKERLQEDPTKDLHVLTEEIILNRFPEMKESFLQIAATILKADLRQDLLERILKKLDTFIFLPAFSFFDDPSAPIRNLVCEALIKLYQNVKYRLSDPQEQNKAFLRKELDHWLEEVSGTIKRDTSAEVLGPLCRLFLTMAQDKPQIVVPILPRLLAQQFALTMKQLTSWEPDSLEMVLTEAIKHDRTVGAALVQGFSAQTPPELIKIILKNFSHLEKNDIQNFRKNFASRALSGRIPNFLDDPDPGIRVSALELLAEMPGADNLPGRIEEKCHDPAPEVRLKALQLARSSRHPKMSQLFEDACGDPASVVALQSLKDLQKMVSPERFNKILVRAINSPSEEIRSFALREVAKITQQRYMDNFNSLPPKVRKLAGSAILKLDSGFVDHLIGDLRSLDPDSRLRAAMIMENLQVGGKGKEALLAGMKDPSKKVRAAIVKTLGVMGDKALLTHLIEFFNDPDERVRANAIEAITGIGDERAVKLLFPFLEDSNNRIRANAALAVWQIGKVNIIPVMSSMLSSKEPLMRASALWVLGEMKLEMYLSMIIPHVKDKNEIVRLNALKAVAKIKPEVLKPLLPMLRQDASPEVKKFVTEISFKII